MISIGLMLGIVVFTEYEENKMSLDFFTPPSVNEIIDRCKTYVKGELEQVNATDQNSVLYSLIVALANLSNDCNKQIQLDILPNVFPQYCKSEESLSNHAYIKNVPRTTATPASGKATIQGEKGSVIPLGFVLLANGVQYKTENSIEIQQESIAINSISVNGTLVRVETASNHNFASGLTVTISGAENEVLNGDFLIAVTGLNSFTYSIQQELQADETEDLFASANIAVLNIKSTTTGQNTNLSNGDALALNEAIEGVSANAFVQFSGVSGGTNVQDFSSWKDNVVNRYRNPITSFNENNIKQTVLSISGVTRCWVFPTTPEVGQCTVVFIRGNDEDIIPDVHEIDVVKKAVLDLRTVKDDNEDIFVFAPTKKVIDFTFSEIYPNTPTMKTAIENSLKQLFEDEIDLGVNLNEIDYLTAIKSSFDMETGSKLSSFTLSNPEGDIEIGTYEYPVLGTITFL